MDHEWMRELCDRAGGSPLTTKPWTVEYNGAQWDVATNGWGLLMVRGASFEAAQGKEANAIGTVLQWTRSHEYSVTADALREWLALGPHRKVPCDHCKGGEIKAFKCEECNGRGTSVCFSCGNDADCEECDGKGTWDLCPECDGDKFANSKDVNGSIAGLGINIRIANQYLSKLPLDGVNVFVDRHDDKGPIIFQSKDWLAIIMPRIGGGGPELQMTEVT